MQAGKVSLKHCLKGRLETYMNAYTFFVDSSCDTPAEYLELWGAKNIDLTFRFVDSSTEYRNSEIDVKEFYQSLRDGRDAKTSAVNVETFKLAFEPELVEGRDVMYLAFSSGLSTTFNSARLAALELSEKYPDRKVIVTDSLCASTGYGMLVYLTTKKLKEGATLEEAAEYAESMRPHMCHWFTVDDLNFLHRGGRVSAVAAFVGTAIGIKPVLYMNDEGKLISRFNVRGRKKAIKSLAEKMGELALDISEGPVYICHGDCEDDAVYLAELVKSMYGLEVEIITYTGPVIGCHSGPGTLALFFLGKER